MGIRQRVCSSSSCTVSQKTPKINFVSLLSFVDANEHAAVRNVLEELGLRPDETITGGLILGFGLSSEPNRDELPRTGNPVTWIE